jgi:short-subunit dehydrogenase
MKNLKSLKNNKIIITGAAGGMGSVLSIELAKEGANLVLVSTNADKLKPIQKEIEEIGGKSEVIVADLGSIEGIKAAAEEFSKIKDLDMIINLAGATYFGETVNQDYDNIQFLYNVNLLAPTMLTQAVLPEMIKNNSGHIVNIGSTIGSVAFPLFSTYAAAKFGLKGFSESIRREFDGTGIKVTYIAPRGTKTKMITDSMAKMVKKMGMTMDSAEDLVQGMLLAIKLEKKNHMVGFQESIMIKLNQISSSIVDKMMKSKIKFMREALKEESGN